LGKVYDEHDFLKVSAETKQLVANVDNECIKADDESLKGKAASVKLEKRNVC